MCEFAHPPVELEEKSFTGYKRVLKIEGRYFSPATGVEYVEGQDIPKPRRFRHRITEQYIFAPPLNMISKKGFCFTKHLVGKTSVYERDCDAIRDKNDLETIVEMTISGGLIKGYYGYSNIIAGNHIEKIKELTSTSFQATEKPILKVDLLGKRAKKG